MRKLLTILMIGTTLIYGQSQNIGIVSDNDGSGLPGVSVKVKGTSSGTVTMVKENIQLNQMLMVH